MFNSYLTIPHRYEIVPCRHWKNTKTGETASLYSAVPWIDHSTRQNWDIVTTGYGYHDRQTGTYHNFSGRPQPSEADAAKLLSNFTKDFAMPVLS